MLWPPNGAVSFLATILTTIRPHKGGQNDQNAHSTKKETPATIEIAGVSWYARLDSNQRPSESELIEGTYVLIKATVLNAICPLVFPQ